MCIRDRYRLPVYEIRMRGEAIAASHYVTGAAHPWPLTLQWCLYTVEVTAAVFHKVFHQVFLQLLFILSWKLALRGHFKISKKKPGRVLGRFINDTWPAPVGPLFRPTRPRFSRAGPGRVLGQTHNLRLLLVHLRSFSISVSDTNQPMTESIIIYKQRLN